MNGADAPACGGQGGGSAPAPPEYFDQDEGDDRSRVDGYAFAMHQDDTRAILDRLAVAEPDLRVKGKKTPYLAVNGNMFAFVDPEAALCLRFAEADRAALAAEFGVGPVIQHNAVMRGYLAIPEAVIADAARLAALFGQSVAHARGLKPKPTRR